MNKKDTPTPEQIATAWSVALENQGLVKHVIKTNFDWMDKNCNTTHADCVQAGMIGLLQAALRYDPKKSKFSVYAYLWIHQSISKTFRNEGFKAVRVPSGIFDEVSKLNKQHKKEDVDEIMKNNDNHRMRLAFYALSDPIYMNDVSDDHNEEKVILKNDDSQHIEEIDNQEKIKLVLKIIKTMPAREQTVIEKIFGLNGRKPEDIKKIAKDMKIKTGTVNKIKSEAFRLIRKKAGNL